jgi:hypothetical protein
VGVISTVLDKLLLFSESQLTWAKKGYLEGQKGLLEGQEGLLEGQEGLFGCLWEGQSLKDDYNLGL